MDIKSLITAVASIKSNKIDSDVMSKVILFKLQGKMILSHLSLLIQYRRKKMLLFKLLAFTSLDVREISSRPRSHSFWEVDVPNMTEREFQANFRMSRSTFNFVVK